MQMEDIRLLIEFAIYIFIIGMVIVLFNYFSTKGKKIAGLLLFVIVPTWIVTAIVKGLEYKYFENSNELFTLRGFTLLLAETLPMLFLLGGITFTIKYLKFKKSK